MQSWKAIVCLGLCLLFQIQGNVKAFKVDHEANENQETTETTNYNPESNEEGAKIFFSLDDDSSLTDHSANETLPETIAVESHLNDTSIDPSLDASTTSDQLDEHETDSIVQLENNEDEQVENQSVESTAETAIAEEVYPDIPEFGDVNSNENDWEEEQPVREVSEEIPVEEAVEETSTQEPVQEEFLEEQSVNLTGGDHIPEEQDEVVEDEIKEEKILYNHNELENNETLPEPGSSEENLEETSDRPDWFDSSVWEEWRKGWTNEVEQETSEEPLIETLDTGKSETDNIPEMPVEMVTDVPSESPTEVIKEEDANEQEHLEEETTEPPLLPSPQTSEPPMEEEFEEVDMGPVIDKDNFVQQNEENREGWAIQTGENTEVPQWYDVEAYTDSQMQAILNEYLNESKHEAPQTPSPEPYEARPVEYPFYSETGGENNNKDEYDQYFGSVTNNDTYWGNETYWPETGPYETDVFKDTSNWDHIDYNRPEEASQPWNYTDSNYTEHSTESTQMYESGESSWNNPEENTGYQTENTEHREDRSRDRGYANQEITKILDEQELEDRKEGNFEAVFKQVLGQARWLVRSTQLPEPIDNACLQTLDPGRGPDETNAWYYDKNSGECKWFAYTGYGGNANRFYSRQSCESRCISEDRNICDNVSCPTPGMVCKEIRDEGCLKYNNNNPDLCPPPQPVCVTRMGRGVRVAPKLREEMIPSICHENVNAGSCQRKNPSVVYYYDQVQKVCQSFYFHRCGGNSNRFNTKQECMNYCSP